MAIEIMIILIIVINENLSPSGPGRAFVAERPDGPLRGARPTHRRGRHGHSVPRTLDRDGSF